MPGSCRTAVRALYQSAAQLGWPNTMWYAIDRLLAMLSAGRCRLYKYYFIAQPVALTPMLPPGRGKTLTVREIISTDPSLLQFPRPRAILERRYRQGARCLAAYKGDALAGYLWHVAGRYDEDEVRATFVMEPPGSAVWDFDVYIEPQSRMGVTFLRLWDAANAMLGQQGVRWSFSRIAAANADSLQSHKRLGAAPTGSALFLKVGRWQAMVSCMKPFVHLSFSDKSAPVLIFDTTALRTQARQPWRSHASSQ